MLSCPVPESRFDCIRMPHGGGGRLMGDLIHDVFLQAFGTPNDAAPNDAAVLPLPTGPLAMTTDSFVVSPAEFAGGTIGSLAVHGTVNDLAMVGARPLYLTAGFILEEGLALELLKRVVNDMARAATACGVSIVTGDTKVVEHGHGDGVFINTAGVGVVEHTLALSPLQVRAGDVVLVSGDLGRHGMTIMGARLGLDFGGGLMSDSAPLHRSVAALLAGGIKVRCLRDITRGGLSATLSEIAEASGLSMVLDEAAVPVRDDVRTACALLGLDPLEVACEGRYLAVVAWEDADKALALMQGVPVSAGACRVGCAEAFRTAPLLLRSRLGVERILPMPSGMQLPRIC